MLHELAILRFLCSHASDHKLLKYALSTRILVPVIWICYRCLVITPNKALCQQRAAHWSRTFRRLDLATAELTGDSSMTTFLQTMARSNIIITTVRRSCKLRDLVMASEPYLCLQPEKWDSVTRSWRKHMYADVPCRMHVVHAMLAMRIPH